MAADRDIFIIFQLTFVTQLIFSASGENTHDFSVKNSANGPPAQQPPLWEALAILKGNRDENSPYPKFTSIPDVGRFSCDNFHQPGYYADEEFQCQVFRNCDVTGVVSSFLCPVQTIFNQITLICDWYYNVDCSRSSRFCDYTNARLYHADWPLLDNDDDADQRGVCPEPTGVGSCAIGCQKDGDCQESKKCCPTSCGGRLCKTPLLPP